MDFLRTQVDYQQKFHGYPITKGLALQRKLCFKKKSDEVILICNVNPKDQFVFSLVHLIIVSGERYRNINLEYRSSSSSSSPVSRTKKISVHSFRMRSTLGSSSNMMEWEIPLKNSRTNFPITRTTEAYNPMMLQTKKEKDFFFKKKIYRYFKMKWWGLIQNWEENRTWKLSELLFVYFY